MYVQIYVCMYVVYVCDEYVCTYVYIYICKYNVCTNICLYVCM